MHLNIQYNHTGWSSYPPKHTHDSGGMYGCKFKSLFLLLSFSLRTLTGAGWSFWILCSRLVIISQLMLRLQARCQLQMGIQRELMCIMVVRSTFFKWWNANNEFAVFRSIINAQEFFLSTCPMDPRESFPNWTRVYLRLVAYGRRIFTKTFAAWTTMTGQLFWPLLSPRSQNARHDPV